MAVDIELQVRDYFNSAQLNASGHRKLIHSLHKLHQEAAVSGSTGEQDFFLSLVHCLNLLLSIKRNEEVISKSMRFLVGFIVCSAGRDEASILGSSTPTTRLIENLMLYALEGIDSRDRMVRVRLGQLMVACVNAVDELGDNVWDVFRVKMTERLFDKEAAVRVQAVHAMARLQSLPLTESGSGGGLSVLDVFLELLAHDPSADVRKAVLNHIDVTEKTIEPIISRRRDVDPSVRRFFYLTKMNEIDVRTLSMKQRDVVLRSGLCDRDGAVRRACIEMVFGRWIQTAGNNLIQLLLSLDVIRHQNVSEAALRSFYEMTPDMFTEFPLAYFENLTPETAIALRVYCEQAGAARSSEQLLPEMSELAMHAKRIYESSLANIDEEEYRTESEFILCELCRVMELCDGSDEMGRRVVQNLLVEMLANLELGDEIFHSALKLLAKHSPDLEEFLQMVGQLVTDLHELYSNAQPTNGGGLDELLQRSLETLSLQGDTLPEGIRIMAQVRCLEIIATSFQLPSVSLSRHPILWDLLNNAVIPAVNSPYAAVQAKGLTCLGLMCTISKDLSLEYLELFAEFFENGQEETRVIALKILYDITFVFGDERMIEMLNTRLVCSLYDDDKEVQAAAAEGYAKLLLHRIVTDPSTIVGLFQLYFDPTTSTNPRMRQTLTYFFQAFSFSAPSNQLLVAKSVLPVLDALPEENNNHSLSPMQIATQLLELSDPSKLIENALKDGTINAHAILAEELAWAALYASGMGKGKLYAQLFTKLQMDGWSPRIIKRLLFVMGNLIRVMTDRPTLTSLKKTVAHLVELDDPTQLLEPEDLIDLRERLAMVEMPERQRQQQPLLKPISKNRTKSTLATVNIMDEITDLLDE